MAFFFLLSALPAYLVIDFDDGTSLVKSSMVCNPPLHSVTVGENCTVKCGKDRYTGEILAMGKYGFNSN